MATSFCGCADLNEPGFTAEGFIRRHHRLNAVTQTVSLRCSWQGFNADASWQLALQGSAYVLRRYFNVARRSLSGEEQLDGKGRT